MADLPDDELARTINRMPPDAQRELAAQIRARLDLVDEARDRAALDELSQLIDQLADRP